VLDKSRLQRMERFAVREPLDRCDGLAVMHCGERQTRVDAAPVEQHRASAALTVIATLLGSREREMFTQSVDKSCPRIERQSMQLSVHSKFDTYWSHRLGVGPLGGQRKPRETTSRKAAVTVPDARTARRVIRVPRCPFSSMTGAFVPGFDPPSLVVKRLAASRPTGV
jgi:hypothetical protein